MEEVTLVKPVFEQVEMSCEESTEVSVTEVEEIVEIQN